ncbi:hypothetical protein [Polaromonas aquatica]|uniref:Recombinase zinc beta ribbon domain-containing protein n=1 Tax=Polaromonas aquatica TaxID=332657 RepID=A0ABW1TXD4_9BURK
MQHQESAKINPDGLRYKTKINGSPFGESIGNTLSCIKCGNHKARSLLKIFLLAGSRQYKCTDDCGKTEDNLSTISTPENGVAP